MPHCNCREDSDAKLIKNAADVKLRSFNTKVSAVLAFPSHRSESKRLKITTETPSLSN